MRGCCTLLFFPVPFPFSPAPSGFLSAISFLSKCPSPLFQLGIEEIPRKTMRNTNKLHPAHVVSGVLLYTTLFQDPIKWLAFDVQTCFRFARRSVSYFSVLENWFHEIYCKEKEKYTKGCRERFLEEETVQQWEMPKKATSGKRVDHSFLCSCKTQE